EEKKENIEKKEVEKAIILKALVHCEGCSDKICKCLKGLPGVKEVHVDKEHQRVTVKGEAVNNPSKVLETLQKKYSKNVELISPKPKPENQQKNIQDKKEQVKIKTVVLNMSMNCEGCVRDVKKNLEKIEGVDSVEVDKENSRVTVKGTMEGAKLVEAMKKKLRKHAEIMKEESRREPRKEVNDVEKVVRDPIVIYTYPPQYATQHMYPNQTFNDENVFACSIM
ncbi:hypothetical protein PHAVU_006G173800, partial [Phaseolus vulgaris]